LRKSFFKLRKPGKNILKSQKKCSQCAIALLTLPVSVGAWIWGEYQVWGRKKKERLASCWIAKKKKCATNISQKGSDAGGVPKDFFPECGIKSTKKRGGEGGED